jgi:hypothetical protein
VSSGQVELGIVDFSAAIRIRPDDSEAYYQRSVAYELLGDAKKAAADRQCGRERDRLYANTFRRSYADDPANQAIELAQAAEQRAFEAAAAGTGGTAEAAPWPPFDAEESDPIRALLFEDEADTPTDGRLPVSEAPREAAKEKPQRKIEHNPVASMPPRRVAAYRLIPHPYTTGFNQSTAQTDNLPVHEPSEIELRRQGKYGVARWQSPQFQAQFGPAAPLRKTDVQSVPLAPAPDENARVKPLVVSPLLRSQAGR